MPFLLPNQQRQSTEGKHACKNNGLKYDAVTTFRQMHSEQFNASSQDLDWFIDYIITDRVSGQGAVVGRVRPSFPR